MSGIGAFVVGAAVGAAAVAHHKNKQKHKHHHHTEVHRTVVFENQPVPNQVVYVAPPPAPPHHHHHPPAPKPKKGQKHHPLPPHQHAVVTTYYHSAPAPPPQPGSGAPLGFAYNPPVPSQATYNAAHPPPYSPHPSSNAPPFTLPSSPAPIPASYPPQSPGYPPVQPYPTTPGYPPAVQSPGYPQAAPFQAPVYPSQSSGYPPSPYPGPSHAGGYPPTPYPPAGQLQAQVTVQLSSAAPGTNQASAAAYSSTPNNQYRRYFYIVSSETRWALQTIAMPGSKLVMQPKQQATDGNGATSCQLWYCDNDGAIRSRFGDHGIESRDGGRWLCVAPYSGDARQQWILRDGRVLANRANPGDCICLEDGLMGTAVNADVIVARYQGKPNHHWNFEYI